MAYLSWKSGKSTGWWYSGTRLYQVVLQPFYDGPEKKSNLVGTVIVGHGIDAAANELRQMSSSQMAFQYGNEVVASTLAPFKALDFARQVREGSIGESLDIDGERFYAKSIELAGGTVPVHIFVLKSYDDALAYLASENRQL